MWILGIASSHNGAAALLRDGRVIVAVQAERLTRRKRQPIRMDEPTAAESILVRYCLEAAGIEFADLDAIATSTPWHLGPPRIDALKMSLDLPRTPTPPVLTVPHHLAHAEYVLHYAPSDASIVLVADGSGTREDHRVSLSIQERERSAQKFCRGIAKESLSAYVFNGQDLDLVYRVAHGRLAGLPLLESVGHLWRWAAYYCCGSVDEAGKVMGLAPYGDSSVYADLPCVSFRDDGEVSVRFDALFDALRTPNTRGADVTGIAHYADVAAHVQASTNRTLAALVRWLVARYGQDTLCYCGGVALNGMTNEHICRDGAISRLVVNGSCEDNGTAIGAAVCAFHHLEGTRIREPLDDSYGCTYTQAQIETALTRANLDFRVHSEDDLLGAAAHALAAGKIIGWYQGRSEFGPRALGNRSILADCRAARMKDILNLRVKRREAYRPFAPVVPEEHAPEFFDLHGPSPLMLRVVRVKSDRIPAVTHVDGSGRVQTVNREENQRLYDLLQRFAQITNVPVLLNTSFNVAGEPIVESPDDAIRTFKVAGLDFLFVGNCVTKKNV